MSRFFFRVVFLFGFVAITGGAIAQTKVVAPVEHLSFNRPEAWALKHFASATLLTGLQTSEEQRFGSIAMEFEAGWLPDLSTEQRRVGFNGTKVEDLNKAPIFVRPRVKIGLPWQMSLIFAATPPIRVFGVKPSLYALALERPIYRGNGWRLGWRAYGQLGSLKGAFTCPSAAVAYPPGSPNNSYGCNAESADVSSLRYAGGEVHVGRRIRRMAGLTPHIGMAVNYINGVFQVNANTFDYLDRTRLLTNGVTVSWSGGVEYPLTGRITIATDVFYSPLKVMRNIQGPVSNDGLFNVRGLVSYRLR